MYIYMCIYVNMYICVYMCKCVYVYMYICLYVFMYICIYVFTYYCLYVFIIHMYLYTCRCICISINMFIYISMYVLCLYTLKLLSRSHNQSLLQLKCHVTQRSPLSFMMFASSNLSLDQSHTCDMNQCTNYIKLHQ